MYIEFTKSDIVVAASAYGARVVRTESVDDAAITYYLVEPDGNDVLQIEWRGTLESCLTHMATSEHMRIVMDTPPLVEQPDPVINDLIPRKY